MLRRCGKIEKVPKIKTILCSSMAKMREYIVGVKILLILGFGSILDFITRLMTFYLLDPSLIIE